MGHPALSTPHPILSHASTIMLPPFPPTSLLSSHPPHSSPSYLTSPLPSHLPSHLTPPLPPHSSLLNSLFPSTSILTLTFLLSPILPSLSHCSQPCLYSRPVWGRRCQVVRGAVMRQRRLVTSTFLCHRLFKYRMWRVTRRLRSGQQLGCRHGHAHKEGEEGKPPICTVHPGTLLRSTCCTH